MTYIKDIWKKHKNKILITSQALLYISCIIFVFIFITKEFEKVGIDVGAIFALSGYFTLTALILAVVFFVIGGIIAIFIGALSEYPLVTIIIILVAIVLIFGLDNIISFIRAGIIGYKI